MAESLELPRARSDSSSSNTSQSTTGRLMLRQRLSQLLTCVEDLSSDDETNEEVSRTLDEAFSLCGRWTNKDSFRLHMVTWNVGTAEPPRDVSSLLQLDSQSATDLYVIGLQEVSATPVRYISDLIADDSWSHLFMDTLAPKGYVKVTSVRMQGLLILLFAKQAHVPYIRHVQTTYTRTGIYGYWGNKGGVSIRFSFYGHMLCFLNCHLAAHMNYALQRMDEFEYILDSQDFDPNNTPNVLDHKLVFWFGDLNFRITDHGMHFLRSSIEGGRFNLLWQKDQLTMLKKKEPLLQEFEEGPLQFKPTYKFDRFSETYDSSIQKTWFGFKKSALLLPLTMYRPRPLQRCSTGLALLLTTLTWFLLCVCLGGWYRELAPKSGKKRKPAWTDRILWRVRPKSSTDDDESSSTASWVVDDDEYPLKVAQDVYTSNMEYGVSDHKPVVGVFSLELRKKFERPLVTLAAEGVWSADEDVLIAYTIQEAFPVCTYDWIGLYKTDFKSPHDYIAFAWAKDYDVPVNDLVKVCMKGDDLPLLSAQYILGYYSTNMQSIVGLSPTFQIQESKQAVLEGLVPENVNGLDK